MGERAWGGLVNPRVDSCFSFSLVLKGPKNLIVRRSEMREVAGVTILKR
jgi:hypothetical protein